MGKELKILEHHAHVLADDSGADSIADINRLPIKQHLSTVKGFQCIRTTQEC
jgi:hypothetical protein